VLRPAGEAHLAAVGVEREPELRSNHDVVADGSQRLPEELLVREGTVGLGGVEECDAALDRAAEQRDHFLSVSGGALAAGHAHAAEAEGRDLQAVLPERALLHCRLSFSPGCEGLAADHSDSI
jgi:hypothetical protein